MLEKSFIDEENKNTHLECARILKLARAVDELVALNFTIDEKNLILDKLEGIVDMTEEQMRQAETDFEHEYRRCALLTVTSSGRMIQEEEPHAKSGDNPGVNALWRQCGEAFTQQYVRHLNRYNLLWEQLLEKEPMRFLEAGEADTTLSLKSKE